MKNNIWEGNFKSFTLFGEGTRKFLQGQTSENIMDYKEGDLIKTCALHPNGRLKALLEIRLISKGANLIVLSGNYDSFISSLELGIFPADKVEIKSDENIIRLQELSFKKSWKYCSTQWLKPKNKLNSDLFEDSSIATKDEFILWRIQQGFPFEGNEINGETNPFELGLGDLIKLNKGCYLGQEVMARINKSGEVKQKLRFWQAKSEKPSFYLGAKLYYEKDNTSSSKNCGFITSFHKYLDNHYCGLALVKKNALKKEELFISDSSDSILIKPPISFAEFISE